MNTKFNEVLDRLKGELGVRLDKEVAEALGMTKEGFNSRKVRGAFPEDKLYALVARRPELGLDAAYVLTGERSPQSRDGRSADAIATAVESRRNGLAPPLDTALLAACIQLVIDGSKTWGVELDSSAIGVVSGGVYDMSVAAGVPNADAVGPLLKAYLGGQQKRPGRTD